MIFPSRSPIAAIVCVAGGFAIGTTLLAQAPVDPLDVQALKRGEEAVNQQKYADAVQTFEGLINQFPQSAVIPQAYFRLGYAYYLLGDYDKAVENFQKSSTARGAAPEIVELALSLTPQVIAAKASKLKADDPARDRALEDAIKQFDIFLQRFPQSEEGESANMGKALAMFQLRKFEEAAAALRANLQKFPQSETIQDSEFTLALVLGADGASALAKATAPDPGALGKLEEGEKLLRGIIGRRTTPQANLALINDAQFQLGEMLNARASFTDPKKKDEREAHYKKALDAYRGVFTKEQVIAAQKQRIENVGQRRIDAGKKGDLATFRRLQRVQEKEQEKLATFEGRGDQTVTAKVKSGQIFFQMGKFDEARVLLTFVEPHAEDPEDKKQVLYYVTMTYALQNVMDKAVERYDAFQAAHKGDPLGENLQLVMAAGYLSKDPKIFNPEKAIQYCKEGLEIYPKGRFTSDLLNVQASALIGLKRYDEALALLKQFIASSPPKELAADAEFNLAIIYKDTGKIDESLKTFGAIRDQYAGTRQAEQAAYWLGELSLGKDPKTAIGELKAFIAKFPESELLPQAYFALARGQVAAGMSDEAVKTFRELPQKFPQSEPAPYSYFERAKLFANQQKYDECLAIMKEFIANYPENPALFQAHDFMAQILASQKKGMEALAIYEGFAKEHPEDPSAPEALLKVSSLWKGYAAEQGPILAQDATKRAEWTKGTTNSITAAEQVVTKYPESAAVALALANLLEAQAGRLPTKEVTREDIEIYFNDLATKAADKPTLQSKIQFTLAGFLFKRIARPLRKKWRTRINPTRNSRPRIWTFTARAFWSRRSMTKR